MWWSAVKQYRIQRFAEEWRDYWRIRQHPAAPESSRSPRQAAFVCVPAEAALSCGERATEKDHQWVAQSLTTIAQTHGKAPISGGRADHGAQDI